MFKNMMCMALVLVLAGCSPNMDVKPVQFGESRGIVSGANLRLVTERTPSVNPKVVCSEPSPDYAVAFGSNRKFEITPPSADAGSKVSANAVTSEYVLEGEGRAEAVLALRDGLYTACQSYANGIIGKDAYAIILSQYGNLLLGLVGKEGASAVQASGPQAAFSAMTVACISGHDRTRPGYSSNSLLTHQFCSEILRTAVKRSAAPARVVTIKPKPETPGKTGSSGGSGAEGASGENKSKGG